MNPEKSINKPPDLETAVQDYLKTRSQEARQNVINVGQSMIDYYAGIYSPGKIDSRLQQAAKEGFLRALKQYDPSRNVLFSDYATHCIISEIRNELKTRNLFKMPEWLKRLQEDVISATEELAKENSSMPSLEDIAHKVNIAEKGVSEAMQAGSVALSDIDLKAFKSLRQETFKLPIEDVIKIRKSMDRLSDIQKKVLSLITVNLKELSLAIEEEEMALTKEQAQHERKVENGDGVSAEQKHLNGFKLDFPLEFSADEMLRYFEVLSDEFGLRLVDLRFKGDNKDQEGSSARVSLEIDLEGRYRGLLQLLDYMRNEEKAIRVDRARTERNENIPARININISLSAYFNQENTNLKDIR